MKGPADLALEDLIHGAQEMRRHMRLPDDAVIAVRAPSPLMETLFESIEDKLNENNIMIEAFEEEEE